MIRNQHTDTTRLQIEDIFLQVEYRNGINSGKGLIQQNEIRRDAQAACDLHPAPLAPRKRITPVLPNHSETQLLDQSLHSLAALVPRNILGFEHSQDVVLDRQLAKDR